MKSAHFPKPYHATFRCLYLNFVYMGKWFIIFIHTHFPIVLQYTHVMWCGKTDRMSQNGKLSLWSRFKVKVSSFQNFSNCFSMTCTSKVIINWCRVVGTSYMVRDYFKLFLSKYHFRQVLPDHITYLKIPYIYALWSTILCKSPWDTCNIKTSLLYSN